MDDTHLGAAFRAVRIRRRWRQEDAAARAGVSRALISMIERGHVGRTPLDSLRRVATALEIRLDVVARWRGGDLDRLVNAHHSALHESVASYFMGMRAWEHAPEVSFSIYGERGVIDVLAFHPASGSLLVIELKTAIVDINDLLGTVDRKRRLATQIAAGRGWQAEAVSTWVIVGRGRTNQRRLSAHRAVLRAAFPSGGRAIQSWLRDPVGSIHAISTWPDAQLTSARIAVRHD